MKFPTPRTIYRKELSKYGPLSRAEELHLAKEAQKGNEQAREKLIKHNLRLVFHIASGYDTSILPLEDLIGAGNEGLLKAVKNFDPTVGASFATYAAYWIRQGILGALADERTIRLPRDKVGTLIRILRAKKDNFSLEALSDELHLSYSLVGRLLQLASEPLSLNMDNFENSPHGDPAETVIGNTKDDKAIVPEREVLLLDLKEALDKALSTLPPRERLVLEYHYGIGGKKQLPLSEIGKQLGISKERVRKIQEHALDALYRDHKQALKKYIELEEFLPS